MLEELNINTGNKQSAQPGLSVVKIALWATAILLVCCTLWTRFWISYEYVWVSFAILFVGGLVWDLKGNSWRRPEAARGFIAPILFLLSVVPILWFLYEAWVRYYVSSWSAGPLLPYSDAGAYVGGAKSLLTFGELGQLSARRPLGVCLIAAVLGAVNQNYQAALIVLTLLSGVATFFAVWETWLTGGLATALLYLALCYLVMLQWAPLFMTETPGYIFGSLGYAFLLAGFRDRSFVQSLSGFGFLILGLMARAGAMFAIVILAGYLIYFFSKDWRNALGKGLAVATIGGLLLALGPLLLLKIGPPGVGYQGNFSYTLYGIAVGGKGWDYVLHEHPEIWQIVADGEKSRYIYSLFWQQVTAHPALFFSTLFFNFLNALQSLPQIFYGLVVLLPRMIPMTLALIACLLLIPSTIHRKGPWAFVLPIALGLLLSSPFLANLEARVYMATVPVQIGLAASAVALMLRQSRRIQFRRRREAVRILWKRKDELPYESDETSWFYKWNKIGFALLLAGAVTVFPLVISARGTPHWISKLRGTNGDLRQEMVFYYHPSSGILIGAASDTPGIMSVSMNSVIHSPQFGTQLSPAFDMLPGDYLYHALFLQKPLDNSFVLFNRIPDVQPGYLKVRVRLLEQDGEAFLFKAHTISRFEP